MDRDRDKMVERILHLTLEILFRLIGKDYIVVRTSSERCQAPVSEGWGRPLSPITGPPPHPLIHEDINDQKILELTYKMIELLTGEVPIRCRDVTVYFSMEEWEYLEGHKDLYKDVMMEVPQPLTSPDLSSERTTPERCHLPLLPQDCRQENSNFPQDDQDEDLTNINTTETYVRGYEWCKEEAPTYGYPDDCSRSSEEHLTDDHGSTPATYGEHDIIVEDEDRTKGENLTYINTAGTYERIDEWCKGEALTDGYPVDCSRSSEEHISSDFQADDHGSTPATYGEHASIEKVPPSLHSENLSSDTFEQFQCFDSSQSVKKINNSKRNFDHQGAHTEEKPILCLECGQCFTHKSDLFIHQDTHSTKPEEQPFSCSECQKCFTEKSHLDKHQRTHTEEKPFSCPECGKGFTANSKLVRHRIIHSGEKPFSCSECRKCFTDKSVLIRHKKIHTGEKPFVCPECGKHFTLKSNYLKHLRIHTGEKPYLCLECGKYFSHESNFFKHQKTHSRKQFSCSECQSCFTQISHLVAHQRIHTGEKPFFCSECEKRFTQKSELVKHQRTHGKKRSFPCLQCGKCFTANSKLVRHQITHTGEKPFTCPECSKCFTDKSVLIRHQKIHTGEKPMCVENMETILLTNQFFLNIR
ncbi:uncharacterized protein LOC142312830 [Anomaloglossus baeobatrachus]|uniref:uncharacterized protein LOC142312830 n=1 Tax=Anomaloglossus baeobatrachus TaxID=238106 RepID=UPI003F4F5C51